jgi:hypothetical protein
VAQRPPARVPISSIQKWRGSASAGFALGLQDRNPKKWLAPLRITLTDLLESAEAQIQSLFSATESKGNQQLSSAKRGKVRQTRNAAATRVSTSSPFDAFAVRGWNCMALLTKRPCVSDEWLLFSSSGGGCAG